MVKDKQNIDRAVFREIHFVKSITALEQRPQPPLPEIGFVGRSNVGKSSLLNALTNRKRIAKVSSTPGKTQTINYFLVDHSFYFVDLPGYGFAKIAKSIHKSWQNMIEKYILHSEQLRVLTILMDIRRTLQKPDAQMTDWLNYLNIPYLVVLTKSDKLNKQKLNQQKKYYEAEFPDHHVLAVSVHNRTSIRDLALLLDSYIR